MNKLFTTFILLVLAFASAQGQLSGTKTIPSANFPTIKVAVDSINAYGVLSGGVTFNVTAGHYERTSTNIPIITYTGGNSIVFQKSGAGANPIITAGVGVGSYDGIIRVKATDNITFDGLELRDTSLNGTTTTQMEYGIVFYKSGGTDASKNAVIRNCTITLNKTNTNSVGISTRNTDENGTTSVSTSWQHRTTGHNYYSNTISNCYSGIVMNGSSTTGYHDANNDIGTMGGNTISNFGGSTVGFYGIYVNYVDSTNIRNNSISGGTGATTTSSVFGISMANGPSTGNYAIIASNTISLNTSQTTGSIYLINFTPTSAGSANVVRIDSNTLTNSYFNSITTGNFYGIYLSVWPFNTSINNNTLFNNKLGNGTSTATGTYYGIYSSGTSNTNSSSVVTINNNVFGGYKRNQSSNGTTTMYHCYLSVSPKNVTFSKNSISGDTILNAHTSGTYAGFYHTSSNTNNVSVYNNSISGYYYGSTGGAMTHYGIYVTSMQANASNDSIYNNKIYNFTNLLSGSVYGIYLSPSCSLNYVYKDSIYNFYGNGTTYGIYAPINTSYASATIRNNYLKVNSSSTTSQLTAIYFYNTSSAVSTWKVDSNYITHNYTSATSGNIYSIYLASTPGFNTSINNNTIDTAFLGSASTSGTGSVYMIYVGGSNTTALSSLSIYNNIIRNFTRTQVSPSTGLFYGIYFSGGGAVAVSVYNNELYNIASPGTSSNFMGIYIASATTGATSRSIYNNILRDISRSSATTGSSYGIYVSSSVSTITDNIYNNVVKNFTSFGTAQLFGLYFTPTSGTLNIYNDSFYNLSSGGSIVAGIYVSSSTTNINIYKNVISDLTSSNTSPNVIGVYNGSGTNVIVSNNRIGRLFAPVSNNSTLSLMGLQMSGTGTVRVMYNTVRINGSSSGSNYGSVGLYSTVTGTLDLRNNIIINNCIPTGTGVVTAFRRSTTSLTTYKDSSGNNIYYAGNPSTYNLIYTNGTNNIQTLSDFRAHVRTLGYVNRDRFSQTENVVFLDTVITSANFLRPDPSVTSYVEGGGQRVDMLVSDDIDGVTRATFLPDIGADEFSGTAKTTMAYNSTTVTTATSYAAARGQNNAHIIRIIVNSTGEYNPVSLSRFALNANNSDNIADIDSVHIYFTGGLSSFDTLHRVATGVGSLTTYGLNSSIYLSNGDNYFWVAYDINASATYGDTVDAELDSIIVGGSQTYIGGAPLGGREISGPMCGTYTVGTSGSYNFGTITEAFYNLYYRGVDSTCTSRVTLELKDANYSTNETFPLALGVITGASSGGRSIIMKPGSGVDATITGANANSLFLLAGTDYFTLDGSNNGTDSRNLSLINSQDDQTSLQAYDVIRLASLGIGAGCKFDTIRNCTVQSFAGMPTVGTSYATYGITLGGSLTAPGSTGYNNDSNALVNNAINKVHYGIYVSGASGYETKYLSILNNVVGSETGSEVVSRYGVYANYLDNSIINNNEIKYMRQYNWVISPFGIYLSTGVTNTDVNSNLLYGFGYNQANNNSFGSVGIYVSTANTASYDTIANNVIYDLAGTGGTSPGAGITGICLSGTMGYIALYHNTVALNSNVARSGGSTDSSACLWMNSTGLTNIDYRNNIFYTSLTNTANSGARTYGIINRTPTTNFNTSTNNNIIYATGSQGYLGHYGGNITTIGAWQTVMGGSRESASQSSDPLFNSSTNMVTLSGSPSVNGGMGLTFVSTDIEGITRNGSTPTVGAYETTGDVTPPEISYTAIGNTSSTGNRTLSNYVTVTDVYSNPVKNVYMYYKKTSDNNTYVGNTASDNGWKYVAGTGSSPFSFVIDTSIIYGGQFNIGDEIQYFFVAEDSVTIPRANVAINSGEFNATPDSSLHTSAIFPVSGTINSYFISSPISGTIVIDSSGTYKNLTGSSGLFKYLNENVIGGDIIAEVASDLVEPGTYSLNALSFSGGPYKLRIVPQSATNYTITGTVSDAMIKFYGTDDVTIDGSYGGSGRYLLFRNNSTTNSCMAFTNDCSSDTIMNCIIEGGNTNNTPGVSGTSSANGTIFIGYGTTSGNDNLTIFNNILRNINSSTYSNVAIYMEANSSAINDQLNVLDNEIANFKEYGIYGFGSYNGSNCNFSGNSFYNSLSGISVSQFPIRYEPGTNGGAITIEDNYIGGSSANCGGSAWTNSGNSVVFNGIRVSVGSSDTSSINGNVIANFNFSNTSTGTQFVAINVPTSGLFKLGSVSSNIIGDTANSGSIVSAGTTNSFGILNQSASYSEVASNYVTSYTSSNNSGGTFNAMDLRNGILNVHDNIIGSLSTNSMIKNNGTGTITGLAITAGVGNDVMVYNNIITGINAQFTSGSIYLMNLSGTGDDILVHDNQIGGFGNTITTQQAGASTIYGIYSSATGNQQIYNNTITGTRQTSISSSSFYGIYTSSAPAGCYVHDNVIGSISDADAIQMQGTGTNYGIYNYATGTTAGIVSNNTIKNITNTGTSTYSFYGIYHYANSATSGLHTDSNEISNLTFSGGTTFYGVYVSPSATVPFGENRFIGNDINSVIFTNTSSSSAFRGLNISSGTGADYIIANNNIGDISTTGNIKMSGNNTTTYGFYRTINLDTLMIYGNTVGGIRITDLAGGSFYGNYNSGSITGLLIDSANTFGNPSVDSSIKFVNSGSNSVSMYGDYYSNSATIGHQIKNNVIGGFSISGGTSTSHTVAGIYLSNSSNTSSPHIIANNSVSNYLNDQSGTHYGVFASGTSNIGNYMYNNSFFDIFIDGTGSGSLYGFYTATGAWNYMTPDSNSGSNIVGSDMDTAGIRSAMNGSHYGYYYSSSTNGGRFIGNKVTGMVISSTGTSAMVQAVRISSTSATNPIVYLNEVSYITSAGNSTLTYTSGGGATGMYIQSNSNAKIWQNNIHHIYHTGTGAVNVGGMVLYNPGGDAVVMYNSVNQMNSAGSGVMTGMYFNTTGSTGALIHNNSISVENANYSNDIALYGFSDYHTTSALTRLFYNSIYTGGTVSSGSLNSAPLYVSSSSGVVSNVNNILFNKRSGGSGYHASMEFPSGNSNTNSNYNLLVSTDSLIGVRNSGTNYTYTSWRESLNRDTSSWYARSSDQIHKDSLFVDASNGDLSINTVAEDSWYVNGKGIAGVRTGGITESLYGVTRGVLYGFGTDIGADEFTPTVQPPVLTPYGNVANGDSSWYAFGQRKLIRIIWHGTSLPTAINARYYSGDNPPDSTNNGNNTGANYMNSYFGIAATGGSGYEYDIKFYYDDALLGNIPTEASLEMAKAPESGVGQWKVHVMSNVNPTTNYVTMDELNSFSSFTGSNMTAPLPVNSLTLNAVPSHTDAMLDWLTTVEVNTSHFNIQRSFDGNNFENVGKQRALGKTMTGGLYKYTDHNVEELAAGRTVYYRIELVDMDGSTTYSETRSVIFTKSMKLTSVYPQPVQDNMILNLNLSEDASLQISVMDMNGKTVLTSNGHFASGTHVIEIDARDIASGMYMLRLDNGKDVVYTRVMKR